MAAVTGRRTTVEGNRFEFGAGGLTQGRGRGFPNGARPGVGDGNVVSWASSAALSRSSRVWYGLSAGTAIVAGTDTI